MTLSERQVRIIGFIRSYLEEHNYPPTIREIGKAAGIPSTSVVKYNLERLQQKGLIERSEEVSRGLRLTGGPSLLPDGEAAPRLVPVRKLGVIAAGQPIAATGQQDNPYAGEALLLPEEWVPAASGVYTLQVKGDSMVDAMVSDGDWVIIKHQVTAQPGDMVVAWLQDREETTLKFYYPEGDRVRLQPANPAYQPIMVPAGQLQIQGKVVGIWRQLS
jgi:repressor LexA